VTSEITVGLDIGTTSVKALAVDGDGQVVARSRIPHEIRSPSADVFEHDAVQAWFEGPRAAMAELKIRDYAGIGIASLVPSFTAVDADGQPLTPGLLYGDYRGRTGSNSEDPLSSGEFRAMLEWSVREAPDAHGYWPAPAVAAVALGGSPAVDMGTGFALAPLWNGEWDPAQLAEIGLRPEQMPIVVTSDDQVGGTIGGGVQVAGMADAWAEATVAGADEPGEALVICGTTLIVWCVVAEHATVPGMWTIPHPRGNRTIVGGASNAGGMFINWSRRALAEPTGRPEPASVPIWVPYLRGERSPLHDVSLRASLHDVDLSQNSAALTRATYEASGFVARRIIDAAAPVTTRIVASGGGVHDREWIQALADCTGRQVDTVAVPEGAALGAAWHARVAAGLDTAADATRWIRYGQSYEPDPRWLGPCRERYERWLELAGPHEDD
jgi:xylulokinase